MKTEGHGLPSTATDGHGTPDEIPDELHELQVLSANKLLGQLGQTMPIPSLGFRFGAATHHFDQTIVLVLSHSGGTYAPLACCSLLSGFTSNIFVVTSELDTQAARAVRSVSGGGGGGSGGSGGAGGAAAPFIDLSSQFVFSTHVGFRSAEPCSVSVVATHHLLTQLLLFLMGFLIHFEHIPQLPPPSGASTASGGPNGGRSDTAAGAAGAAGPPIPRHLPTSDAPAAAATTASAAATAAATATPAWPAPISICGSSFELAEVRELAIDCDGFRLIAMDCDGLRLIAIDCD